MKKRTKKVIPEMMPTKKWLSLSEACSYLDISINHFPGIARNNGLTVSFISKRSYYKVSELDALIENNAIKLAV